MPPLFGEEISEAGVSQSGEEVVAVDENEAERDERLANVARNEWAKEVGLDFSKDALGLDSKEKDESTDGEDKED